MIKCFKIISSFTVLLLLFCGCDTPSTKTEKKKENTMLSNNADWWKNANIYEVNIRQYTPEGTFAAFRQHLPRLKDLGVDILWFMPIHPISEKNRKGTLGSYYAVSDYRGVNPDFGTIIEFKDIVEEAHSLGMKVLMDWVPNHTGFDHVWAEKFPDYHTRDEDGNILIPSDNEGKLTDWTDVAELNYSNMNMRQAMIEDMKFWVRESNIDGYRCDVAFFVPDDFWSVASKELKKIKPVFMLAESEHPPHRNSGAFQATYGWDFHHLLNALAKGEKNTRDILQWQEKDFHNFGQGFQMSFITNHDENSWNGTIAERLGEAEEALAILAFTLKGMPLIYSGQEAGLNRRLKFFEKDSIDWSNLKKSEFYKTLLSLKHDNQALWNGPYGGVFKPLNVGEKTDVFAFEREKNGDKVIVVLNLSKTAQNVVLQDPAFEGEYNSVFGSQTVSLSVGKKVYLDAWGYAVFSNK